MSAQHTPGPWAMHRTFRLIVVPAAHVDRSLGMAEDDEVDRREYANYICDTSTSERRRRPAEQRANAHLISAAPDLLAACTMVASFAVAGEPLSVGDIQEVLNAIAKAEGR